MTEPTKLASAKHKHPDDHPDQLTRADCCRRLADLIAMFSNRAAASETAVFREYLTDTANQMESLLEDLDSDDLGERIDDEMRVVYDREVA